jgi:hypothetical protein
MVTSRAHTVPIRFDGTLAVTPLYDTSLYVGDDSQGERDKTTDESRRRILPQHTSAAYFHRILPPHTSTAYFHRILPPHTSTAYFRRLLNKNRPGDAIASGKLNADEMAGCFGISETT